MVNSIRQIYKNSENKIKDIQKEIMRHIIGHKKFEGIDVELNGYKGILDVTCHCGKSWVIDSYDISRANMETKEVYDSIEKLNTPAFFRYLKEVKIKGETESSKRSDLFGKTGSPTISSLEI